MIFFDLFKNEVDDVFGGECWCFCRFRNRPTINMGFSDREGKKIESENDCFYACKKTYGGRNSLGYIRGFLGAKCTYKNGQVFVDIK